MKKLLIKIFIMMLCAMGLVFAISRTALFVMEMDGRISTHVMYYISIVSGLLGLLLFAFLLNIFVFSRLKKLSRGVKEVANGNYSVSISASGKDEIGELTKDFNSMTSALNSNDYLNREFARNVSHEFKTPLSSIIGFSKLLEEESLSPEERKDYISIIRKEAERLTLISKNMLEISKIDSGAIIVKENDVNICEQIRSIVLSQQNLWLEKNIEIDAEISDCFVKSSEELLYHIFQNLISNAVKFCNENGKITIKLFRENCGVVFTISNTGEKIGKEEREKIFNLFYCGQSKNSGSGLGLPLVKKIVERLNGKIDLENCEETTFKVNLPL